LGLAVVVARSSEQTSCDNFHRDQSVISPVRQRWDDWKMAITRATTMAGFVECTHVELFEDVESWTGIVVVVAFLCDRWKESGEEEEEIDAVLQLETIVFWRHKTQMSVFFF